MIGTKLPAVICICPWYTLICGYAIQIYNTTSDWKMRLQDWGEGSVIKCLPWKHEDQRSDMRPPGGKQVAAHTYNSSYGKEDPWSSVSCKCSWIDQLPVLWGTVSQKNIKWRAKKTPTVYLRPPHNHLYTYAHTYKSWYIWCTHIHTVKERKYNTKH